MKGTGTLFTCIKAGIPSIVFPLLFDQYFWARRVADLMIGPSHFYTAKEITKETLENQIRWCIENISTIKPNVKELSDKLNSENGVERVVNKIFQFFSKDRKN